VETGRDALPAFSQTSGRSAEGNVVVRVQQLEPGAQIVPARSDLLHRLVKMFAAFVISWAPVVLIVRPCGEVNRVTVVVAVSVSEGLF
jgi:hypothetical protein